MIYHGIYHGIYHMVYTNCRMVYTIQKWYIPSKSGIYHVATVTFKMTMPDIGFWHIAKIGFWHIAVLRGRPGSASNPQSATRREPLEFSQYQPSESSAEPSPGVTVG
jgi:hypothetical protein